jgi:hypothetical protein
MPVPQPHERGSLYEMLEENNHLIKENNRLLHKLHRAQLLAFWGRILFILIIIGAPFFLYQYFLKDYVGGVLETYSSFQENVEGLDDVQNGLFGTLNTLLGTMQSANSAPTTTE